MSIDTIPEDLTDRQREVLVLTREGRSPTAIGNQLGISSQGVQGHLRRLREKGLLPPSDAPATTTPRAVRRPRQPRTTAQPFTPEGAFDGVRASIREQREGLIGRQAALDGEVEQLRARIKGLGDEKKNIEKTLAELERFEQTLPGGD